ncbi:MAG: threonylcarbamoyl-AMP synthase [Actinobacteria bacterium]|nr:threonylcarbamoyl-AMP synthase [Actinomycetota bacterium]
MSKLIDVLANPERGIDRAVAAIAAGKCIVLPTDTVYGIGADALSAPAVQSLLDAKQRGRDMPPPVLIAEPAMLRSLAATVSEAAEALVAAFWPGALTLVVESQPNLRMDLGDRGDTIAVRIPDHGFTRELLRATGPLAVSSANTHGNPAATTAADARAQLGDTVTVYLDAGAGSSPVPSTIVDVSCDPPRVLREGRITSEELAAVVGRLAKDD